LSGSRSRWIRQSLRSDKKNGEESPNTTGRDAMRICVEQKKQGFCRL
jgi:hypothetical protein